MVVGELVEVTAAAQVLGHVPRRIMGEAAGGDAARQRIGYAVGVGDTPAQLNHVSPRNASSLVLTFEVSEICLATSAW